MQKQKGGAAEGGEAQPLLPAAGSGGDGKTEASKA